MSSAWKSSCCLDSYAFQAKWCFKDLTFNKILMASVEGQVITTVLFWRVGWVLCPDTWTDWDVQWRQDLTYMYLPEILNLTLVTVHVSSVTELGLSNWGILEHLNIIMDVGFNFIVSVRYHCVSYQYHLFCFYFLPLNRSLIRKAVYFIMWCWVHVVRFQFVSTAKLQN